jgi:ABC-type amino acid transport substrate-binding protein
MVEFTAAGLLAGLTASLFAEADRLGAGAGTVGTAVRMEPLALGLRRTRQRTADRPRRHARHLRALVISWWTRTAPATWIGAATAPGSRPNPRSGACSAGDRQRVATRPDHSTAQQSGEQRPMNRDPISRRRHRGAWAASIAVAALLSAADLSAGTVEEIRERGMLRCGVNGEVPGMSLRDEAGNWSGLDVDFCRAVATAVLGDPEAVAFVAVGSEDRFRGARRQRRSARAQHHLDRQRDITEGVSFVGVLYYDGQGFMVPRKTDTAERAGARSRQGLRHRRHHQRRQRQALLQAHRMALELITHPDLETAAKAYLDGKCTALTTDRSQLHALRATLERPAAQRILPEVVSKEPLAPAVAQYRPALVRPGPLDPLHAGRGRGARHRLRATSSAPRPAPRATGSRTCSTSTEHRRHPRHRTGMGLPGDPAWATTARCSSAISGWPPGSASNAA